MMLVEEKKAALRTVHFFPYCSSSHAPHVPSMFLSRPQQRAADAHIDIAMDAPTAALPKPGKQKVKVFELTRESKEAPLGMALVVVHGTGVIVSEIESGSNVEKAGIMPGDTIVCAGSEWISTTAELKAVLKRIAGPVEFRVHRSKELPKGWKSVQDPKTGRTMYFKAKDKSVWSFQHPLAALPPAPLVERPAQQQSTLELLAGARPKQM